MPYAKLLAGFALGRLLRFWYYAWRRKFRCPRGRHGNHWQYFGSRSRVCRICHAEEWYSARGGWLPESHKFAESRSSWSHTHPEEWPAPGDER